MDKENIQAAIRAQAQLSAPPAGFAWKLYGDATFLKPVSWYERERIETGNPFPVATYSASPERFSETRQFEMGLSLQVIRDTQKLIGVDAKKMVDVYLNPHLNEPTKKIIFLKQDTVSSFDLTFLRYKDAPPGQKPIIVHKYIMASSATDALHIFIFESPVKTWDKNWIRYGTPILSNLRVETVMSVDEETAKQFSNQKLQ